ncbi:hypothetical protein [Streptomyces microflavus]|uniref:hypothetical protein n=1 Tax=Streptomyces microflavus TaxID=1919 RepID=UPI00365307E5
MPKNSGSRAVPENVPASAVLQQSTTPSLTGETGTGRLSLAHVLPLTVFPMIGGALHMAGMPTSDIFAFLGGCGGIGAAVTIAVTGGRRTLVALAHGVLAAAGNK